MWGADDPDERKPMVWSDLRYEDEVAHPFGRARRRDKVAPDTALFRLYSDLAALRKEHLRLFVDGALSWIMTDDARGVLVYDRVLGEDRAVVAFNVSEVPVEVSVKADDGYRQVFPVDEPVLTGDGGIRETLPPRTARVWVRE
jgi:glycosidase